MLFTAKLTDRTQICHEMYSSFPVVKGKAISVQAVVALRIARG
jgi:hypothetical protein